MTYDPHAVLASIDQNVFLFLGISGTALVFNYIYFWQAGVSAKRDGFYTFPLACSTIWFAHDLSFVLLFNDWFNVYNHWYLKLFWLGLIPTTLFELFYIYQTWLYGKKELMPNASQALFNGFMAVAIIFGLIAWYALKQFLDDPLYVWTFGSTGLLAPALVLGLILKRGHTKGQSVLMWGSYVGMQTFWFSAAILVFGDAFRTPQYLLMAAASILGGVIVTATVKAMSSPTYQPQAA